MQNNVMQKKKESEWIVFSFVGDDNINQFVNIL